MNKDPSDQNHSAVESVLDDVSPAIPDSEQETASVISDADPDSEVQAFDAADPEIFVRQYLAQDRIGVLFDRSLTMEGALLRADVPEEIGPFLATERLTEKRLVDRLFLLSVRNEYPWKKSHITSALSEILEGMKEARFRSVVMPLVDPLQAPLADMSADDEWRRLGQLFDMPSGLTISVWRQVIWVIKQKVLARSVAHHLMPVVSSSLQGSGKTTFVRKFVSPLCELASPDALLSDFTDRRSGDIYEYPVVVVDDMETIPASAVPVLKNLITAERINRRKLGTSNSTNRRQRATLIGTANAPVHQLIDDISGHRRFVTMPFRNGNVATGGDDVVWKIVSTLDYRRLWLSVDAFGPAPIRSSLDALYAWQAKGRPVPPLLSWLRQLDVHADAVKAITVRAGVRADGLHELYTIQTGNRLSRQRFSEEMAVHMADTATPFARKDKLELGAVYRFKSQSSDRQFKPDGARPGVPKKSVPAALSSSSASTVLPVSSVSSASPASPASPASSAPPTTPALVLEGRELANAPEMEIV